MGRTKRGRARESVDDGAEDRRCSHARHRNAGAGDTTSIERSARHGTAHPPEAAAEDILADAATTLEKAKALDGSWSEPAIAKLEAPLALARSVKERLRAAELAAAPANAALDAKNDASDDLIARISDECWNLAGRPGSDAALDVVFPGGYRYYTEGDVTEQPDRMDLLAELLRLGLHPKITVEKAEAFATEIVGAATELRAAVEVARPLRVRVTLTQKVHYALARSIHTALTSLKRTWKAEGKSEADIHKIIPDRPNAPKRPETPAAG